MPRGGDVYKDLPPHPPPTYSAPYNQGGVEISQRHPRNCIVRLGRQTKHFLRSSFYVCCICTALLSLSVQIYLAWTPPSVGNPPITDKRSYLAGIRTHHYYNATPHKKLRQGFYVTKFGLIKGNPHIQKVGAKKKTFILSPFFEQLDRYPLSAESPLPISQVTGKTPTNAVHGKYTILLHIAIFNMVNNCLCGVQYGIIYYEQYI